MVMEFSLEKFAKKRIGFSQQGNKPIILFGAGAGGYLADVIRRNNSIPVLFCDNNSKKWGTVVRGVSVISFDELKSNYRDSQILITAPKYYDEILNQLTEHNLDGNLSKIAFDILYNKEYENYHELVSNNYDKFALVYNMFFDEYSKQTFYAKINYCISADSRQLLAQRSKAEQYFENDIITFTENEIFIDGGAYTGDTIEAFLHQTSEKYTQIYSFEPDQMKYSQLQKKFGGNETIQLLQFGMWNKKDTLHFEVDEIIGGGSRINNGNRITDIQISTISIDEVLKGQPATFIKMDIEGAELEALQGAQHTIKTYRPKLAICVYHKPLDIVEIPLYIKKLVPEYKLYLRHYSGDHLETVLYAVSE